MNLDVPSGQKHYDGGSALDITATVDKVIKYNDDKRTKKKQQEIEDRHMVRANHQLKMRVVIHGKNGEQRLHLMELAASISFQPLKKAVMEKCGLDAKIHFAFIDADGEVVELNMETWRSFIREMWCVQPWVIHVHKNNSGEGMQQYHTSKVLFDRYDVNRDGRVERHELARMLTDLRLERFDCSPQLIDRFVDRELQRLDSDGSGDVDLLEFTKYVSHMTSWMRTELLLKSNEIEVFAQLAGRAVEAIMAPTPIPRALGQSQEQSPAVVIMTKCFGIRLEIPMGALPPEMSNAKISIQTLFRGAIAYLAEDAERPSKSEERSSSIGEATPLYSILCSPVVRVDYPAFEKDHKPPQLGGRAAPRFLKPLTLIVPHCFDAREGAESIAIVAGAPHGAVSWEPLAPGDATSSPHDGIKLCGHGTVHASTSTTHDAPPK